LSAATAASQGSKTRAKPMIEKDPTHIQKSAWSRTKKDLLVLGNI